MARRRHHGGRKHFKIPLLTLAILGGQAAAAHAAVGNNDILQNLDAFQAWYTGILFANRQFYPANYLIGWGPWLVKGLATKVARPMGAAPKIPFGLPFSMS